MPTHVSPDPKSEVKQMMEVISLLATH